MHEIEEVAFDELTLLLTEIADYKRKFHATVNQQFFLIKKALSNTSFTYHSLLNEQKGSSNLNRLKQMIVEKNQRSKFW